MPTWGSHMTKFSPNAYMHVLAWAPEKANGGVTNA